MIIEAILISTMLSAEPAIVRYHSEPEIKLERKRSNKRRRKVRKPVKGLR